MPIEYRVAFLTNLIPPYHKRLYVLLTNQYRQFRFFISTPMEANRPWLPEWKGLDVVVQKGLTLHRRWKHPQGFEEPLAVHFPTDTLGQLWRFHPDVVVSAEMGFRSVLAYVYAKLHPRCRFLIWSEVTAASEQGRGRARQLLRRFLAPRADGYLTLGDGGVRYLQSLGASSAKVFKFAYSTDLAVFTGIPLERYGVRATRILYCGQLVERKGLAGFISALAGWATRHPERAAEFWLVGDGPLRRQLAEMPVPSNVKLKFIGTLQYNQLPDVYADAGIFVLPTLVDTWAVVVNEALASGVPVLGSVYSQAVEEMVEDGENGWRFRPDHVEEVYSALDRALSSSESELNRMRARARSRALEVTPERAAAVFDNALRSALENR
jgi:glycosyltransferase involved in cell wall biosynthesis